MPRELVLDPTGGPAPRESVTLAPRPDSLRGKTLGLVDNAKPNAAVLLGELGKQLTKRYGVRDVILYTKPYFGTPVEPTQVEKIIQECDFVVTAIGD
jgi:hypothetical protein